MKISEEQKAKKREQMYWREKIRLFEDSKANTELKFLLFETGGIEKIPPWFGEILLIVLFCMRTAYANAYDWDNLTSQLYYELTRKLRHLSDIEDHTERERQKSKLDKFLETLPAEFPDYEASFGFLRTGLGEALSKEEFEALWKFMESLEFRKFAVDYLTEAFSDKRS